MIADPTLLFASMHSAIDPELISVCSLDVRNCDTSTARLAFEKSREIAESGSAFAMCMCSRFCREGWGTAQSDDDAFKWAKRASDTRFPPGQYELGRCYEDGIGVRHDLEEACRNYIMASDGGFGFAACHLASIYHTKEPGSSGNAKAFEWAKRAYELNESMAPLELARWYEQGEGVIKNEREAAIWYARASELGNFLASSRLSMAYALGNLGFQQNAEMARKYEELSYSQSKVADSN
jgi:hypothetical protein